MFASSVMFRLFSFGSSFIFYARPFFRSILTPYMPLLQYALMRYVTMLPLPILHSVHP